MSSPQISEIQSLLDDTGSVLPKLYDELRAIPDGDPLNLRAWKQSKRLRGRLEWALRDAYAEIEELRFEISNNKG